MVAPAPIMFICGATGKSDACIEKGAQLTPLLYASQLLSGAVYFS
jgi:hypothetical protein